MFLYVLELVFQFLVMFKNTEKKKKQCKSSVGDPHSTEYWPQVSVVTGADPEGVQ